MFQCRDVCRSDIDLHRYHHSVIWLYQNHVVHSFHFDRLRMTRKTTMESMQMNDPETSLTPKLFGFSSSPISSSSAMIVGSETNAF